ncbi:MAG: response regulator [Candidatus Methylomirabilales bacterium]
MRTRQSILLIEDDIVDQAMVREALKTIGSSVKLVVVSDGEEALEHLRAAPERPGLILLDLNLPRMNGLEFLRELRQSEGLRCLPVVVLSTSANEPDVEECYRLCVAGYMVKPMGHEEFVAQMRAILDYWLRSVQPR